MNRDAALAILQLGASATMRDVVEARRRLVAALHPDKHPDGPKDVYERLTADVLRAEKFLLDDGASATSTEAKPKRNRAPADPLEITAEPMRGNSLVSAVIKFEEKYTDHAEVALSLLSLDLDFKYSLLGREISGVKLELVAFNRTVLRRIVRLEPGRGVLIDNVGHQYSAEHRQFHWVDSAGHMRLHSSDLVPDAQLRGFLIYPPLRADADYFRRWYLVADAVNVSKARNGGDYDIILPQAEQRQLVATRTAPTRR
jgi:hypothetical protein